jgi:hypothetical protein
MTAYELAAKFADRIERTLSTGEFDDMLTRNAAETNPAICHTHDFCDANQVMIDVLTLCDIEYNPQDDGQRELIDSAWRIAKGEDFHVESIRNSAALGE